MFALVGCLVVWWLASAQRGHWVAAPSRGPSDALSVEL
jgi:hypothetical protein